MNEITLTGRVNNFQVSLTRKGDTYVRFSIAIDDRFFDRAAGEWKSRPTVWQDVVVFKPRLAGNVADTLGTMPRSGRGVTVAVTGTLSDNSYTREARNEGEEDVVIRRVQLVATGIAIPLDFVTAAITPDTTAQERARAREQAATDQPAEPDDPSSTAAA